MTSNNVTIKIPEVMNPFLVVVNGKEYSYPAGQEVDVPEEVAEVIQNYQEQLPKPDPISDESDGGGIILLYSKNSRLYKDENCAENDEVSKEEALTYARSGVIVLKEDGFEGYYTATSIYTYDYWDHAVISFSGFEYNTKEYSVGGGPM